MHVPFDPRWDRLPHLFAGELAEDEAKALREWIDAVPEHREAAERLHELWRLTAAPRAWNAEAGLAAIRRRTVGEYGRVIAQVEHRSRLAVLPPRRHGWLAAAAAAAAAAVVLVAGGVTLWQVRLPSFTQPSAATFTEFTTRPGQRLALRLQDGTLVTLAPSSKLRQPLTYGRTDRTLYLDGEAAFVVVHDAGRPFAVHAARAIARDLGTRFVVQAYAADPATDVVVGEGVVAVRRSARVGAGAAPHNADSVVLTRGQRARITPNGDLETTSGVALDPYFSWTEGRLIFQDIPLVEAARQLARWHDVEIRLADSVTAARRLTAAFGDEPVSDVIHRIAASLDLDVRQTDRTFTLRAR